MKRSLLALVLLIVAVAATAQSNIYSAWSNFPQDPTFFPLAVWLQGPTGTPGFVGGYPDVAMAMKAAKMNVLLGLDGGNGGFGWPSAFGTDCGAYGICGEFKLLVNNGLYVIPTVHLNPDGTGVPPTNTTAANTIASVLSLAGCPSGPNCKYVIGWNLGDEPHCSDSTNYSVQGPAATYLPALVPALQADQDSTRPYLENFLDFVFGHGTCWPPTSATNTAALQAISIGSADTYPLNSAYNTASNIPFVTGQTQDAMWINGWITAQMVARGRSGQPIWMYVDTGDNEYGNALGGGSACSESTNLCTPDNHEYRTPPEQVNADVWNVIINGAMGIEWFCHDLNGTQVANSFCLGATNSGEGSIAQSVANNITYVNGAVLNFAPQLNSPVLARCTMQHGPNASYNVAQYTDYYTSCSNGILTMSTGTPTVPGSAIIKNYNGTLYLFADSDRNGSALMTFTLSGYGGATATVVYDSNAQYDPAHSSMGATFPLNSNGQFSDQFGANGHNYEPKIYKITRGGPLAPTGLTATVQ